MLARFARKIALAATLVWLPVAAAGVIAASSHGTALAGLGKAAPAWFLLFAALAPVMVIGELLAETRPTPARPSPPSPRDRR